jgi:uncharacterized protein YeeX (DUF496 family)
MDFINNSTYSFIKDLLTFLLTIAGIIIAGIGLRTWKKQIKGTKEFEVAYDLNYSVLELRNAIKHVRNPVVWPIESSKAVQYFKNKYPERVNEADNLNNYMPYVYEMRWEEITDSYTKMESHLLAAEVLWGDDIAEKIRPLNRKVTELKIKLQQYLRLELGTDSSERIEDVVYDHSTEDVDDAFGASVKDSIESLVDFIKTRIS